MKIRLIAAGLMAVLALAGIMLVSNYIRTAEARALEGQEPREVYRVAQRVPEGTPVDELGPFLEEQLVPAATVPADAVTSLSEHQGTVAGVTLQPGEVLLSSRLVDPITLEEPGTIPVPEGMREVTFTVGPDRVVGGQVEAGDRVGVVVTFSDGDEPVSELEFENMLITAVQGAPVAAAPAEGDAEAADSVPPVPTGSMLLTVAVTPEEAEKIVYANEFGSIWLTKVNEDSEADQSDDGATREDF